MTYITRPFFLLVETFWTVLPLVVAVDLIAVYLLVFKERMDPRSFAFWMTLTIVLPFLGFALYLLYGCTLYSGSVFGRKLGGDREMGLLDDPRIRGADLPTEGNYTRFYDDLAKGSESAVADIVSAERTVHVSIYRPPTDSEAPGFVDALCSKAEGGADVRVLLGCDVPGSIGVIRRMKAAGVCVRTFHRRLMPLVTMSFRFKNRRIMAIVDGRAAYVGEQSVIRLEGPAASRLEDRFLADWSFATGRPPSRSETAGAAGSTKVQIVSTGPDAGGDWNPALMGYVAMLNAAEKSIALSEPYLVPDENVYNFLKLSALSGVDVKVVVSGRGGHWYQKWNTAAAASSMLDSGARVFFSREEFQDSLLSIDGRISGISMAPFNGRAMLHDFHTSILVESEEISAQVSARLEGLIGSSEEMLPEDYSRRTVSARLKIGLSRMMMLFNRGGHVSSQHLHERRGLLRRHPAAAGHPRRDRGHSADVHGALRPQVVLRLDHRPAVCPASWVHPLPVHGPHGVLAHRGLQRPGVLEVQPGRLQRGSRGRYGKLLGLFRRPQGREGPVRSRR